MGVEFYRLPFHIDTGIHYLNKNTLDAHNRKRDDTFQSRFSPPALLFYVYILYPLAPLVCAGI